jgi:hypothetical protein
MCCRWRAAVHPATVAGVTEHPAPARLQTATVQEPALAPALPIITGRLPVFELRMSTGLCLRYQLKDTQTARTWLALMAQMQPDWLVRSDLNHRHGFAHAAQVLDALARLQRAARQLGLVLDPLDASTWQAALNRLHLNFPEFFRQRYVPELYQTAHEMNLAIHWLEYELGNVYGGRRQYLFNLDFNHIPEVYGRMGQIPVDEMHCFSPELRFGNLHLHYVYVGRHFLEMFDAQDYLCPVHHFKAQHEFNATCGLVFSEPEDWPARDAAMRQFHARRGGWRFFGYEYDDPRLARGFFKLGELVDLADYADASRRDALRTALSSAHVQSWHLV